MNIIIENITQLARRDRLHQEKLVIHDWLRKFLVQFAEDKQLARSVVAVSGNESLQACIDPNQMSQVISNLVQNAIRHSPDISQLPLVQLDIGVTDNGIPRVDITDHGEGIPPEIADNIFDPFFTTASTGTGLGLYISRELCESNGGGLQLISDYTEGTRFRVTFLPAGECR